jgi:membrane associated rhomboid family serine protease
VLGIAAIAFFFPMVVAWSAATFAAVIGLFLLFRALLTRARRARGRKAAPPA